MYYIECCLVSNSLHIASVYSGANSNYTKIMVLIYDGTLQGTIMM